SGTIPSGASRGEGAWSTLAPGSRERVHGAEVGLEDGLQGRRLCGRVLGMREEVVDLVVVVAPVVEDVAAGLSVEHQVVAGGPHGHGGEGILRATEALAQIELVEGRALGPDAPLEELG